MSLNQPISMTAAAVVKKILPILILGLFFCGYESFGQQKIKERKYDITVLGIKIGEMVAGQFTYQDSMIYKVNSKVAFWMFGNVNVDFEANSWISDGMVVKTNSTSSSNRGNFSSNIQWNGKFYEVDASNYKFENKKPISDPIDFGSVMMFFHEPKAGNLFLGEVFGLVDKVRRIENNGYEVTINGNTNRYYFKEGVLVRAVMENSIKNYVIKLVE
jgi:hypothetical protein